MSDWIQLALAIALIGVNAFFVAAEFSLISARRDRLEALAEQGKASAVTVIRAGQQLSLMLAGAQLGVTVASILLGRLGEATVADLLRSALDLSGLHTALVDTLSFVTALALVVVLHVLLGEMVPKNIALAGPERTAMLLVPPYLAYLRLVRPLISFYNTCAYAVLRVMRVEPKDELSSTVSVVELSDMIAESVSEGLLDREEHTRLTRALQVPTRVVADVAVPLSDITGVPVAAAGCGPTVDSVTRALAGTGYSRFPVTDLAGHFIGYLHIKDVLMLTAGHNETKDGETVVAATSVRPLPQVAQSLPLAEALARMRRSNSHLALVTSEDGTATAMVTMEDLVEELVGEMSEGNSRN